MDKSGFDIDHYAFKYFLDLLASYLKPELNARVAVCAYVTAMASAFIVLHHRSTIFLALPSAVWVVVMINGETRKNLVTGRSAIGRSRHFANLEEVIQLNLFVICVARAAEAQASRHELRRRTYYLQSKVLSSKPGRRRRRVLRFAVRFLVNIKSFQIRNIIQKLFV